MAETQEIIMNNLRIQSNNCKELKNQRAMGKNKKLVSKAIPVKNLPFEWPCVEGYYRIQQVCNIWKDFLQLQVLLQELSKPLIADGTSALQS